MVSIHDCISQLNLIHVFILGLFIPSCGQPVGIKTTPRPAICPVNEAYAGKPPFSSVLRFIENYYIIFVCLPGYKFETNIEGVLWCNWGSRVWSGKPGECKPIENHKDPCNPNPCHNGGKCRTSEDPYGWGFYCYCGRDLGGRLCQFREPCKTKPCPTGTAHCLRSYTTDAGRFCYSAKWQLLNKP